MLEAVGVPPLLSALPVGSAAAVARAGAYVTVREAQSAHWASETVATNYSGSSIDCVCCGRCGCFAVCACVECAVLLSAYFAL